MDNLQRSVTQHASFGRRLGLVALIVAGTAGAALGRVEVGTVAARVGTTVQGTITLRNTATSPAIVTSLRHTLEVSFDDGYVPSGLPPGERDGYWIVATTFPAAPASLPGNGSVAIPFAIDVCAGDVASYPGGLADDVRSVAVVASPAGGDAAHSDGVPAPNQNQCPVCGNQVREGTEQCDGGTCCTPQCTFETDGTSCVDGNACTQTDRCEAGVCVGRDPVVCQASDQCHQAGTCQPATGVCSNPAKPNGSACDDGDACSVNDACTGGTCGGQAMRCDDGNVCTTDACSAGACTFVHNTAACDDGNACTTGDVCAAGACTSGGPRDCDDHRTCTTDACAPASGCTHAPAATCDTCDAGECTTCREGCAHDQSACTDDCWLGLVACLNGCGNMTYCAAFCQADFATCANACPSVGAACNAACDTGNGCSASCSAPADDQDGDGVANGVDNCPATANPGQADLDGDGAGDACDAQTCGNGTREGTEVCDGGGCCTALCTAVTSGTACDDGNACTRTDACQGVACVGANPVVCTPSDQCHAAGTCNPSTGTCSDPARPDGAACTDGDACTTGDRCTAGRCGAGAARTCDDGEPCTADACDAGSGCTHTPIDGCTCQVGACRTCRGQCGTTGTCSTDCWDVFWQCVNGCGNMTYCAAFCQADLAQCLSPCPPDDACRAACDAANGCGGACTPAPPAIDGDADGIVDDADNCAAAWNPGQADIDGDGAGDVCDAHDAALASGAATAKAAPGGTPTGRILVKGTFATTAAGDVFDADSAVAVTVTCGGAAGITATWPVGQCRARSPKRITCTNPERSATATFQAGKGGTWKYKAALSGLAITTPPGPPVVVELRHGLGPIDRVGELGRCTASASTLRCSTP